MNKPKSYDETPSGNIPQIALGGHRAIIHQVEETKSKSGKQMIIVSIDFAAEDTQPKYFENQYRADTRADKKWPYKAVQYILTEDSEGNTNRSFKSFCTSFEKSNNVQIQWGGSNWAGQFKNKRIGVVYSAVEEEYNGKLNTQNRIRYFCDDHKALEQDVPDKKFLNTGIQTRAVTTATDSGDAEWMPFRDNGGDGLPFN